MPLANFHPAVAGWFAETFAAPTEAQVQAWPAIQSGRHALIAAPTGSGKTLAAFLAAIDGLVRRGVEQGLADETAVVYVSPLKALSNDIRINLEGPLAGIRAHLQRLGLPDVEIRTFVRTGDTPQAARAQMKKRPPHIVVTTPESLYILLGSESGRGMLATTRTVIVDEIHAIAGSKRGSHLALSLERLDALAGRKLVRVGLSATQKPIEEVAKFLVGSSLSGDCTIIDTGHIRHRDLAIEVPISPLEAVMSNEVWEQVYDRLTSLVHEHKTTLIFVNTRRAAERAARHLSERLGKDAVTAHHGSMAKEHRLDAEQRLKQGRLKALVATASLELGIDIGDVDLVCQLGSPRAIAAFLQRVGRSGHAVGGLPKGRLFPQSRDDLVECAALLDSVRRGELDRLHIPEQPIDVLAQQIVAEVACREWQEDELLELVRGAYPFRDVTLEVFSSVVRMLAEGYSTQRGTRGAYLHRDAVNRVLRARRNARLTAITCGGAIPDTADYNVVLEPQAQLIGTVHEDFAVESLAGDVFQLGNISYRILRVERGRLRVEDAHGAPPSMPFWLGEAPGRSDELSFAVSRLREEISRRLDILPPPLKGRVGEGVNRGIEVAADRASAMRVDSEGKASPSHDSTPIPAFPLAGGRSDSATSDTALCWLIDEVGITASAAQQLIDYLSQAKTALGLLPTQRELIMERFFDESGGMQLVIHSPYGSRINRAWGLALRKRFCRKFNFELQAAATEDCIVLSLSTSHSFPLDEVVRYLHSNTVRDVLVQALLDAPMFGARWRWNATISLALPRFRGGKKVPPQLLRMDAEDLLAAVFPDQIACAENLPGERDIPDHPLVNQTIDDCLHDAMDMDGLLRLLRALENGAVKVIARDVTEPSPLALEVLSAKPYAYLDDAPLEERRTQAVMSRRWLDPESASDIGRLDPEAIVRVREEAWPVVRDADELHEALLGTGFLTDEEMRAHDQWEPFLDSLVTARRATKLLPFLCLREQSPRAREKSAGGETRVSGAMAPARRMASRCSGTRALQERMNGSTGASATISSPSQSPIESRIGSSPCKPSATAPENKGEEVSLWIAAERVPQFRAVFPDATQRPPIEAPVEFAAKPWNREDALTEIVRSRITSQGPVRAQAIADSLTLPLAEIDTALLRLEAEGFVMRGRFTPGARDIARDTEWCERRLLARIHRYTVKRLRQEIEPVEPRHFMRFLFDWQHVSPDTQVEGPDALASVVGQLEGYEAPAAAWEAEILPARVSGYEFTWLDDLCLAGRVVWTRLSAPQQLVAGPVRTTPIALLQRRNLPLWTRLAASPEALPLSSRAQVVADYLISRGASFFAELADGTRLLRTQLEEALAELVAGGRVNADSYAGLRALLVPSDRRPGGHGGGLGRRGRRRSIFGVEDAGRWTLVNGRQDDGAAREKVDPEAVEHIARTLLKRYGVVFWRMLAREAAWLPPWRDLLRVYHRLEARGEIRGGRFVAGVTGEQFALPEAVSLLRKVRRRENTETLVCLVGADPLNLLGSVIAGPKVPALTGSRILFRDGVPIATLVAGEVTFLETLPFAKEWAVKNTLLRGHGAVAATIAE